MSRRHSRIAPPEDVPGRIIVLAGGNSSEREISLLSGAGISTALRNSGYDIQLLDPLHVPVSDFAWLPGDIAFLALHGTHGEDGEVQQQLDSLNVRYTGSKPAASRLAFDKGAAKRTFLRAGLPTPPFQVWTARHSPMSAAFRIGFPLVVKPVAQGSSLGVTIVHTPAELPAAIAAAQQFPGPLLLERAIPGEEWTVAVLNDTPLPPIRINTPHEFFDFTAKYQDGATSCEAFPALDHPTSQCVAKLAVRACQALGCTGLCRVDFRVDAQGQPWLLEVNTLPGMTSHSLAPLAAREIGWSMARLCEEVLRAA